MGHEMEMLSGLAARDDVLLRRQVLAAGLDDKSLRRAVSGGVLHRVRHGCYVAGDAWRSADDAEQLRILTRAVLRVTPGPVVASHHSASALHGLDLWDVDTGVAHVTRLDAGAGRRERDVVHHEAVCLDGDHAALARRAGPAARRPARRRQERIAR